MEARLWRDMEDRGTNHDRGEMGSDSVRFGPGLVAGAAHSCRPSPIILLATGAMAKSAMGHLVLS